MTPGSTPVPSVQVIEPYRKTDRMEVPELIRYLETPDDGGLGADFYVEEYDGSTLPGDAETPAEALAAQDCEVFYCGRPRTAGADVEDWAPHSMEFPDGERVVVTEKIPGVFTGVSLLPVTDRHPEAYGEHRNILVFSKGPGAAGFAFKNDMANLENIQVRATAQLRKTIEAKGLMMVDRPLILLGAAVPREGGGRGATEFWLFAALLGYGADQRYMGFSDLEAMADYLGVPTAPVLYRGPYGETAVHECTEGESLVRPGMGRQGAVIERQDSGPHRVALQSLAAEYPPRADG